MEISTEQDEQLESLATELREDALQQDKAAVEEAFETLEGMELPIQSFLEALKRNPELQEKVELAADLAPGELEEVDLEAWVQSMDVDASSTLSYDEFVAAIVKARSSRRAEEQEAVIQEALMVAAKAFEGANLGRSGDLDLQSFMDALFDPETQMQLSYATKLPMAYFESLTTESVTDLFNGIDVDASGSVSFKEWVKALVQTRLDTYQQEKEEEAELLEDMEAEQEAMEAAIQAEEAEDEAVQMAEDAFDAADIDFSEGLTIQEFISAFKFNTRFLKQVSIATEISEEELSAMHSDELESLFQSLDTDFSGQLSFDEFVSGFLDVRRRRQEENSVMNQAYLDACIAFEAADFQYTGQLDLSTFLEAMSDLSVVESLSQATKLPLEYFDSLDQLGKEGLFREIDKDDSGAISFEEWVKALVNARFATYQQEKQEEEFAAELVAEAFEDADEDWSGSLDIQEFTDAFKSNPIFLNKVSEATGLDVNDLESMQTMDIEDLFLQLDVDFSGTVSFQEFVKGLMQARAAHRQREPDVQMEVPQEYRYVPPDWVQELPPLHDAEKRLIDDALVRLKRKGITIECRPSDLSHLVQELYLWAPEDRAKAVIEDAFPGRDLSNDFNEPDDWYVLYQAVLSRQPVWTKPLTKSAKAAEPLTAKDIRRHESSMRRAYDKLVGNSRGMHVDDLDAFFVEVGLLDKDLDLPRILSDFERRRQPGRIYFPELVELCNDVISGMLRNSSNTKLSGLLRMHPKRAYAGIPMPKPHPQPEPGAVSPRKPPPLPTLSQVYLGETGAAWTGRMSWITSPRSVMPSPISVMPSPRSFLHAKLPPL